MSLQQTDVIYIKGYKTKSPSFYCEKHFRDLIGFPTKVLTVRNGEVYVTHPELDVVPMDEDCIDYVILDDINVGYHHNLKEKLQLMKLMGVKRVPMGLLSKIFDLSLNEQEEVKKIKSDDVLVDLIDKLNNNEVDIDFLNNFIGGLANFISLLKKKGMLDKLDPFAESFEDIQNSLFYAFYKSDPNFIKKITDNFLSDISRVGDDYYFKADFNELASFYDTNRNTIDQDTIKSILSGGYDDTDRGYDTDDVYRDVYEEIDDYSRSVVDEFIVNELEAMKVFKFSMYKKIPDLIEEIAEEQETEGEINLTNEVIVRLMVDADCLEFLINKQLSEVEGNLNSIFSVSYGDVLSSQWYNTLWNSLEGEVIDNRDGEEYAYDKAVWLKNNTRGTKRMFGKKYKVTKCIHTVIGSWLEMNKDKNGQSNNTIPYFGSYYNLIEDSMQYGPMSYLDISRLDEYPDYRELRKSMSSNVENYF